MHVHNLPFLPEIDFDLSAGVLSHGGAYLT